MAAVRAHFAHSDTPRIMTTVRDHAAASEGPVLLEATPVTR